MKKEQWIAIFVSLFVVIFFFIFSNNTFLIQTKTPTENFPSVSTQDQVIGQGQRAEVGDLVTVHFVGKFSNGEVFYNSQDLKEPKQFILGSDKVIAGLSQGIVGMRIGGKRVVTVPPELAYGINGYGAIPGNETLTFEIQLLNIQRNN